VDVELLKKRLQEIDWKKWLKLGGMAILFPVSLALGSVGLALVLGILSAIFIGIPVAAFGLLKGGYAYLSTQEHKYYYVAAFMVILLFLLLVFRRISLVSLSSQSLAYRRNLFFAFFLVFLVENFNLDVAAMFRVDNEQINAAAKGILALFALYSFIEYAHNFLFDCLRSKNESRITQDNSFFRAPKLVDPWLIFIGNYRFLFDFALPIVTSAFILIIYSKDIRIVFGIGKTYVTTQVSEFVDDPENADFKKKYETAKINLYEVFQEAKNAAIETYENTKERRNEKSKNIFSP